MSTPVSNEKKSKGKRGEDEISRGDEHSSCEHTPKVGRRDPGCVYIVHMTVKNPHTKSEKTALGPFVFTEEDKAKDYVLAKWKFVFRKEAEDQNSDFNTFLDEDTDEWLPDIDFAALLDSPPEYRTPYGYPLSDSFGDKLLTYKIVKTVVDPRSPGTASLVRTADC